jgi:hypothetical protein
VHLRCGRRFELVQVTDLTLRQGTASEASSEQKGTVLWVVTGDTILSYRFLCTDFDFALADQTISDNPRFQPYEGESANDERFEEERV